MATDLPFAPIDPNAPALLSVADIQQRLPHRYPFALVDKVVAQSEDSITAVKAVTLNEPFFQGHFPGNPVMPGVLQVEALVQAGGLLAMEQVDDPQNYWTYFIGIDKCRFKNLVVPGDMLVLHCTLAGPVRRGMAQLSGQAFVGDKLTCSAQLTAMLVKKED